MDSVFISGKQNKLHLNCTHACIVLGCNNTADPQRGFRLNKIRFQGDALAECIKRRKMWLR